MDSTTSGPLPSGDLSKLIGGSQYQTASEVPEGVNLQFSGEPVPADVGPLVGNVAPPVAQPQMPSVTPQPPVAPQQPTITPQQVANLQRAMHDAAAARIEAEEAKFEASISHLSEEEQEAERLDREVQQTRMVNGWLNQKLAQTQQQTQAQVYQANAQKQEAAKRMTGFLAAQQFGLPFNDPIVRQTILSANSPDQMREFAKGLAERVGANAAQNAQRLAGSGVFAAGGNVGNTPPAAKPVERSGDLGPLISGTGYTFVTE